MLYKCHGDVKYDNGTGILWDFRILYDFKAVSTRDVHGYMDEGGLLKNKWKNIFKEPAA